MASPKLVSDQEARSRPAIGGGGGNDGIEGRLRHLEQQMARVENQLQHVATKEDIARMESALLKWLIGVVIAAVIATAAVMRFFA